MILTSDSSHVPMEIGSARAGRHVACSSVPRVVASEKADPALADIARRESIEKSNEASRSASARRKQQGNGGYGTCASPESR